MCVHSETEHLIYDISKLDGLLKHNFCARLLTLCRLKTIILLNSSRQFISNCLERVKRKKRERNKKKNARRTLWMQFVCKWEINHRVRISLSSFSFCIGQRLTDSIQMQKWRYEKKNSLENSNWYDLSYQKYLYLHIYIAHTYITQHRIWTRGCDFTRIILLKKAETVVLNQHTFCVV